MQECWDLRRKAIRDHDDEKDDDHDHGQGVVDDNHDNYHDDDFFREVVVVAHCRGSSSRQALVPHLVLFSG